MEDEGEVSSNTCILLLADGIVFIARMRRDEVSLKLSNMFSLKKHIFTIVKLCLSITSH